MREASNDVDVLLYAPGADAYQEELVKNADRVFYREYHPNMIHRAMKTP